MALEIIIASARCLTGIDPTTNMKLYVVVSITGAAVNRQIRAQTDVDRHGGGNPTWNFPVKFDVDGILKQDLKARLVFSLKCEDGKGDKDLGEVHVSVTQLLQGGKDGNSMGSYVAVSHPVRGPSGETVALLNFHYKFCGSPTRDTPAAGFATRGMEVYPPQGYNYPPPPPPTGHPPPSAAGYGGYPPPPPQSSNPYLQPSPTHYIPPTYPPHNNVGPSTAPPSPSHYMAPPAYPPYSVGPSAAPSSPSHYIPPPAYPPYNVGQSAAPPSQYMPPSPYPHYNVGPSAAPPYAHTYSPHPSHVQARGAPAEQHSVAQKKKWVWESALEVASAVAVGVISGATAPSALAPNRAAGFQTPDPSAYTPQNFSFINTVPDPSALRDATYVDYSSLV